MSPIFLFIFLFGSAAVISQSLLIRELIVVLGGNEICIGIVLGSWLAAVACGGLSGAWAADRRRITGPLLAASAAGIALGLPCGVIFVRLGRLITAVAPGEYVSPVGAVLIALMGTFPVGFFVGLGFPVVCRMAADRTERTTAAVGWVYAAEGLGSLIGGLLFSFVLIGRFDAFTVATCCGTVLTGLLGAAMLTGGRVGSRIPGVLCVALAVVLIVMLAAGLSTRVERTTVEARWRAANPALKLLDSKESVYQNISVGEWEGQYSFFGNGVFMLAFPDEYESARTAHLVMTQHPAPRTILIVGGGVEGVVGEILAHPVDRVHCVHLDPELTKMVTRYMKKVPGYGAWLDDERLTLHHEGGRAFVNATSDRYDLVFLNVPDPTTAMLNRYYTEEFYREVRNILVPGGVVAARVSAPSSARIGAEVKGFSGSVYAALRKVFAHCVVTPGEVNYFFASDSPGTVSSDPKVLTGRYTSRGVSSDHFAPEIYSQIFPSDWVKQIDEALSGTGDRINTDMNPVTYFYGLVLWLKYSASAAGDLLLRAGSSNLTRVVPAVLWCVLALAAGILVSRTDRGSSARISSLITVGSTGLAAMAMALVIMLGFQSFRGYVYQKVGILVGTFMGGMAIGALAATWRMRKNIRGGQSAVLSLLGLDVTIAGIAVLLPLVLRALAVGMSRLSWPDLPFYALAVLVGSVTGAQFALANRVFQANRGTGVGRSAGLLEWADHLGGMVGAVLVGVLLVPLAGVWGACLAVAAFKIISIGALAVTLARR